MAGILRASPARPAFMTRGPVGILGCQVPGGAARGAGAAGARGGDIGAGGGADTGPFSELKR